MYDGILSAHLDRKNNGTAVKPFNAIFDNQACKNIFTQLRKAANHPLLLRTRHTSEKEIKHLSHQLLLNGYFGRDASCTIDLVRKELEQFSDFDVHCAALDLIEQNPHCRVSRIILYGFRSSCRCDFLFPHLNYHCAYVISF